ncbi:Scavenger receptor cysteine-rich type 1 protein M130 [Geodia barretti]|uniref:Scavenger receptor cysteine-rich type 1 protein M130 n=1 Tax=Geodia barretti TaxID=519541 RepID=A0AA35RSW5_GEOBA|nr:Scavenger receptor cysteine-rich type 1 protein M130 [Geodia barretti]
MAILTVFFLLLMLPFGVVGSVRLVNGNRPCEGRVEVFYRGQWGTVCDDSWDIADANVVCLQVGCGTAVSAPQRARYGRGSGPIWMDEVYCNERNTRLEECQFGGWGSHDCRHSEDASAICEDFLCPAPRDIANGSVSYTGNSLGDTAHYSCDNGFILFGHNVTRCQKNSTWENPPTCLTSAISFQSNQYTAIEGVDESVTITVVRYGDNSSDLCVSISISGGNEAMLDVPLNLFLVASEIQSTLTVPVGDDVIVENDETTTIVLSVNNTDVGIINNTDAVITIFDNDGYSAELTVEIVSAASLKVSWHKNDTDTIASTVKYECATPQTDHIASTIERTLPYPDTSTYFDISFCYYDPEKKYKHTATLLQTSTTPSKEPTLTSNSFYIDYKYFQIQFGPMKLCLDWKVGEQQHIESKTAPGFSESFIGQGYFLCHDNPNTPTYRSYITTPYPVSTNTNSSDLLAIIENWISSAPIMLFDLLLVKINPRCPIGISSLNEPECFWE